MSHSKGGNLGSQTSVMVRMTKPPDTNASVFVATKVRQAPPVASSLPWGLRIDNDGQVVPHSMLGTLADYEASCTDVAPEINHTPLNPPRTESLRSAPLPRYQQILKGLPTWTTKAQTYFDGKNERQMEAWDEALVERDLQQQRILRKLQKQDAISLRMNSQQAYRRVKEERTMIDSVLRDPALMPTTERGKGFRVGSEYWQQPNVLSRSQLQTTLTKTEQGSGGDFEFIGYPDSVRRELGATMDRTQLTSTTRFFENPYLTNRHTQLGEATTALHPHIPDMSDLEVIGNAVRMSELGADGSGGDAHAIANNTSDSDDRNEPRPNIDGSNPTTTVFGVDSELEEDLMDAVAEIDDAERNLVPGPHLTCYGSYADNVTPQTASHAHIRTQETECRLVFSAPVCEKSASDFVLHNTGTTALYYHWEKVEQPNVLGTANNYQQLFFFDVRPRSILPGEKRAIPIHFISKKSGIFIERWQMKVLPKISNAPYMVLHGTADEEDHNEALRVSLESQLESTAIETSIRQMIYSLVARVHTTHTDTPPPGKRHDELFAIANDDVWDLLELKYNDAVVAKLAILHRRVLLQLWAQTNAPAPDAPTEPTPPAKKGGDKKGDAKGAAAVEAPQIEIPETQQWNLSITNLKKNILDLVDDSAQVIAGHTWETQHTYLSELTRHIDTLVNSAASPSSVQPNREGVVSEVIARMIDAVAAGCEAARLKKGLPEMPLVVAEAAVEEAYMPKNIRAPVKGAKAPPKPKAGGKDDKGKKGKDTDVVEALAPLDKETAAALAPLQFILARHSVVMAMDEMVLLLANGRRSNDDP
eukprot:m.263052 g.263052  ORF g.263052 m.263052 type:complete len:817 (+) comp48376_c0_seq1:170-2620(+)